MHLVAWVRTIAASAALLVTPVAARAWGGGPSDGGSGSYLLLGGGVDGFTDSTAKSLWNTGGDWTLRIGAGDRSYLGFEVGYVGSFHGAKAGSLDLLANGAEGVIRVQYPYVANGWLMEPFVFGGIGWSYLSLRNAPAGVKDTDNIGDVPFGAGVMLGSGRFLVDARFTYRSTFNEDLAPGLKMHSWAVTGAIGFEF